MEGTKATSYILWYHSNSHQKDRFFVGLTKKQCLVHGFHPMPAWSYEKAAATVLDGLDAPNAKQFAEACGYKELILEPIDEQPSQADPESQDTPIGPEVKAMLAQFIKKPETEKVH